MTRIHSVAAFTDNYIWVLENGDNTALVVDPGDAAPVEAALLARGLSLSAILITHHHFDHVGGLEALKRAHGCAVYGPANPAIQGIDHSLCGAGQQRIGAYDFEILAVPGHTLDHIAYFHAGNAEHPDSLLFCGDTLFAGGCGRIFEGDAAMMHASLQRLAALPEHTQVFCGHEYTLANLAFARAADPCNRALDKRVEDAQALRAAGTPTLPSTLGLEQATNPFLRCARPELQAALPEALAAGGRDDPVATFAALRAWKDRF